MTTPKETEEQREKTGQTRRQFLGYFSSIGLTATLLPGVLWTKIENVQEPKITRGMLKDAALVAGLDFTETELDGMVAGANQSLGRFDELRKTPIDMSVSFPLAFIPIPPGASPRPAPKPPVLSKHAASVRRPQNIESVASWPVTQLAELLRTRQVRSIELTEMYLDRLKRYNPKLNCVVTMTDDLALSQARDADKEIAGGRYRGLLHGMPWGCKDIIAVRGYPTTWGSKAFKDQMIDTDASVVRLLREAGAVLVAKLATGEFAGGDQWFNGRTNNPWDVSEGSSGSSAGPASATAAGLVGFGIGTETSGSILSPSSVCGATGLRPTFGRVPRTGVMTLSFTQDRLGPLCRAVEDCAVVLHAIARPDGQDFSVTERVFEWDGGKDFRKLRVGYVVDAFDQEGRNEDWRRNDRKTLDDLRALGVKLLPFTLPAMPTGAANGGQGVEAAAAFDDLVRSRRNPEFSESTRANGYRRSRLSPAVDYIQAQRVRGIIARQLADATEPFDVYVAPYIDIRNLPGRGQPAAPPSALMTNFTVANMCGYPAVALPNGFTAKGPPTSITFIGRPYAEAEMLLLAKAYQDATHWHEKHPVL